MMQGFVVLPVHRERQLLPEANGDSWLDAAHMASQDRVAAAAAATYARVQGMA